MSATNIVSLYAEDALLEEEAAGVTQLIFSLCGMLNKIRGLWLLDVGVWVQLLKIPAGALLRRFCSSPCGNSCATASSEFVSPSPSLSLLWFFFPLLTVSIISSQSSSFGGFPKSQNTMAPSLPAEQRIRLLVGAEKEGYTTDATEDSCAKCMVPSAPSLPLSNWLWTSVRLLISKTPTVPSPNPALNDLPSLLHAKEYTKGGLQTCGLLCPSSLVFWLIANVDIGFLSR